MSCKKTFALCMAIGLILGNYQAFAQTAEELLSKGIRLEEVKGELEKAIEVYQTIVASFPENRPVAAKSLLHIGLCYEKLGRHEAQKAYWRLIREFADQQNQVAEAQARLAAIDQPRNSIDQSTMVVRLVWKGGAARGAVSSDGRYLTFTDWETGDLAIRELATGRNRRLTSKGSWNDSDEFAEGSVVSPEGKQIAYAWYNKDGLYDLRIIGSDGSNPRVLYSSDKLDYIVPSDWSTDGKHILTVIFRKDKTNQIVLISAVDGSVRVLKTMGWQHPGGNVCFSPDGRYIVYDILSKDDTTERDIFIMATDGTQEIPLIKHPADDMVLDWTPEGKKILFSSDRTGTRSAWAISIADGEPQGTPEVIRLDIGRMGPIGFTRDGAFYYSQPTGMLDVYTFTIDPVTGKVIAPPTPITQRFEGSTIDPVWSPDGRFLAYILRPNVMYGFSPCTIVICSLENGKEREISPAMAYFHALRWSPDGHFILVSGIDKKGRRGIYRIDVQTGDILPIVNGQANQAAWSSNGKMIFYVRELANKAFRILVRDFETNEEKELYQAAEQMRISHLTISPDGKQLAFSLSGKTLLTRLMIMPTAGGSPSELLQLKDPEAIPCGFHGAVEWIANGHQIVFVKRQKQGDMELWRIPVEGGEPQDLGITEGIIHGLRVHPDGKRVAFAGGKFGNDVWVMENFLPE